MSWQHHRTSCSPIISFKQEFSSTWTPTPAEAVRFSPTPGRWCPNWEPLQGGRSCQGSSGQQFWGLPVSRASEEWMYFCNLHLSALAVFVLSHLRPPLSLTEGPFSSCGQVFSVPTGWLSVPATVLFTFVATTLSRALAGPILLLIAQPYQGCSFWGYQALLSMFNHAAIEADKFLRRALIGILQATTVLLAQHSHFRTLAEFMMHLKVNLAYARAGLLSSFSVWPEHLQYAGPQSWTDKHINLSSFPLAPPHHHN